MPSEKEGEKGFPAGHERYDVFKWQIKRTRGGDNSKEPKGRFDPLSPRECLFQFVEKSTVKAVERGERGPKEAAHVGLEITPERVSTINGGG